MRLMDDYVRERDLTLSIAKWEINMGKKDSFHQRKRQEEAHMEGTLMTNKLAKELRIEKLKELYKTEELMYEEELTTRGLRFRKERV